MAASARPAERQGGPTLAVGEDGAGLRRRFRTAALCVLTVRRASGTPADILSREQKRMFAVVGITLALGAGCGNKGSGDAAAAAEAKAFDAAAAVLVQPVALISAYRPHLTAPDDSQKYFPKRHSHLDRALTAAANEIRHAANGASQNVERAGAAGTKELETALKAVAGACAEAQEPEAFTKCNVSLTALDAALAKADTARVAAGASTKIPRIAPESVTEEAKKAMAGFLKVKGPNPAEAALMAKRADPAASTADVITACQAAADEADAISKQFEKAEEPLRLVAVTHKMSADSQCGQLTAAETLRKELGDCKKKAKSSECKIVCAKTKGIIDDGLPAASFEPMTKEYAAICEKK
jgi:hypothetical protein